jgi:hypothetical protein
MRTFSRDELLRQSGADLEDLAELESRLVIQPKYRWLLFDRIIGPEEYDTERDLVVLRFYASGRYAGSASR